MCIRSTTQATPRSTSKSRRSYRSMRTVYVSRREGDAAPPRLELFGSPLSPAPSDRRRVISDSPQLGVSNLATGRAAAKASCMVTLRCVTFPSPLTAPLVMPLRLAPPLLSSPRSLSLDPRCVPQVRANNADRSRPPHTWSPVPFLSLLPSCRACTAKAPRHRSGVHGWPAMCCPGRNPRLAACCSFKPDGAGHDGMASAFARLCVHAYSQ